MSPTPSPPVAMSATYAEQSAPQRLQAMPLLDLFKRHVLPLHIGPAEYALADFGAAEGATSAILFAGVLGMLLESRFRGNGSRRDAEEGVTSPSGAPTAPKKSPLTATTIYNDLPGAPLPSSIPPSLQAFLTEHQDTLTIAHLANSASFHGPCLPPSSVDLALTNSALHWLSSPAPAADLASRAASDWHAFWLARRDELKPGGFLLASLACLPHPSPPPDTLDRIASFPWIPRLALRVTHLALSRNLIRPPPGLGPADLPWPLYPRTPAECLAPFTDHPSAIPGLRLRHHEVRAAPHPIFASFLAHGDPARYAREQAAQSRGFFGPSVRVLWADWDVKGDDAEGVFWGLAEEVLREEEGARYSEFGRMFMVVERVAQ
ncbi:S-adenosyl-L-methionine-dependent methyltransferase [Hyaloraphidium curvatum]|nr:S-adenosyl-L-methionine-dependent methyltransferase [Hyaloraphidium curvatum]